ncbi:unnamed protein product [Ambrosiozyma monospora]|uniref:Unnamed protein product n=1 Tax=Ambrosiozyma monospora TaxID=43982 RepID=A0ACB5TCP9_AMBMO|nr:unnamed protein product [Ambrosiozyma monospora]
MPIFPEPVKDFLLDVTDADKYSLGSFIEAYDKYLRFRLKISEAILGLPVTPVKHFEFPGLTFKTEPIDNIDNLKKFWKKNNISNIKNISSINNVKNNFHRSTKNSKKRVNANKNKNKNKLEDLPCFNCGKYGHSLFSPKCPRYANIKKDIDHDISKADIIKKYRSCYNKHYHTNF